MKLVVLNLEIVYYINLTICYKQHQGLMKFLSIILHLQFNSSELPCLETAFKHIFCLFQNR